MLSITYREAQITPSPSISNPPSGRTAPEAEATPQPTAQRGPFKRISLTRSERPKFVIVLTDLADTQYRDMPHIASPQGDAHVLVLAIPAEPHDALLTIGKPLSGPEQFDLRTRQLKDAAPWITVAPYFARNLAKILKSPTSGASAIN